MIMRAAQGYGRLSCIRLFLAAVFVRASGSGASHYRLWSRGRPGDNHVTSPRTNRFLEVVDRRRIAVDELVPLKSVSIVSVPL